MTIYEYLAAGNHVMSDTNAITFPFYNSDKLKLTENLLQYFHGQKEMIFSDENIVELIVLALFNNHYYNWNKKYESTNLVYNPLERTNYSESETIENSGSDTKAGTTSNTNSITNGGKDDFSGTNSNTNSSTRTPNLLNKKSTRPFDSSSMIEVEEESNTGTETNGGTESNTSANSTTYGKTENTTSSGSNSETSSYGHKITNSKETIGRDNLDIEDMIKEEREIAEYNFIEMIANEIAESIALSNFDFSEDDEDENFGLLF